MGRGSFANRGGGSSDGAKMEITANTPINAILNVLNNTDVRLTAEDMKSITSVLYNNVNVGDSFVVKLDDVTHTFKKISKDVFAQSDDPMFMGISISSKSMAQQIVDFTGLGWKVSYKAK